MAEARLVVTKGELQGKEFPFKDGISIGRSENNDIVLKDDIVSRQHARIEFRNNAYIICDLGSHNGIQVNDARITEGGLKDTDLIQIGSTVFQFRIAQADATIIMEGATCVSKGEVIDWVKKLPLKAWLLAGCGVALVVLLISVSHKPSGPIREQPVEGEIISRAGKEKERLKIVKKISEFASLEDLLKEAEKRFTAGEQLYKEREITQGNLYRAVEYFKDVVAITEHLTSQPSVCAKAKESLKIAEVELDKQFRGLRFMLEKSLRLKEWAGAMHAAESIMSMFPNPVDERYKYARKHYVRLKKIIAAIRR